MTFSNISRLNMARSEARMYTATHMVLFNFLLGRLDCPHQARAAEQRVRALCSGILREAEELHHLLKNSANTQHCVTDLWLEQSKARLCSPTSPFFHF